MAEQDLYNVLGLSSDATNFQIRAAHAYLIGRVEAGEIPFGFRPAIEQAYATLSEPERRERYDAQLEAPLPPSHYARTPKPLRGYGLARASMFAAAAAMLAGVAIAGSLLLPARSRHAAPAPAQPITSLVISPTVAPQPEASAPPAGEPSAEPAAPSPEPEETTDAESAPPPPSAPAPVSRPVTVSAPPYRAPASTLQAPPPRRALAQSAPPAAEGVVEAPATPDEADAAPEAESVEAPPSPAPSSPVLVQSSTYSRSNRAFRVAGRYCQDAAGGQVYIPIGAPVTPDLSC
jgi:hypothetical protein